MKHTGKAKGGYARAKALTKERRHEIARAAACARWGSAATRDTRKRYLTLRLRAAERKIAHWQSIRLEVLKALLSLQKEK